jgi:hypothetical protein
MFAVMIERRDGSSTQEYAAQGKDAPSQASGSLFRQRAPANGDALLPAQEGRFLFHVQVEHSRVIECAVGRRVRRLVGWWVQLLLRDGGTAFSRHQIRSVVVSESLSANNYNCFWGIEVDESWSLLQKK